MASWIAARSVWSGSMPGQLLAVIQVVGGSQVRGSPVIPAASRSRCRDGETFTVVVTIPADGGPPDGGPAERAPADERTAG